MAKLKLRDAEGKSDASSTHAYAMVAKDGEVICQFVGKIVAFPVVVYLWTYIILIVLDCGLQPRLRLRGPSRGVAQQTHGHHEILNQVKHILNANRVEG